MSSQEREKNIDFAGYFDLAKAPGESDPDTLSDHEILQPLKDSNQRYPEIEKINQGGMKRILSGHDSITGRKIAIARLLSCDTADDLELFLREARITACLEHPNIMPVYDIALDEEGLPFFTMKLVEGEDLRIIIDKLQAGDNSYRKEYRLAHLLEMFLKICDAIAYAHNRGIVHLDLKPQNIKTSGFGEVLVCDWGLARLLDQADPELVMRDGVAGPLADISRTINGAVKGTPGYMSPEQANPKTCNKANELSDIYSLGALLYSLLTYERPIVGTTEEILKKTLLGELVPPSKRTPSLKVPHSLNAVVMKAMATETEDRYQSVKELQNEVRQYVEGYATEAENASFHRLVILLFKRHAALAIISVLILIVIPFGTLIFLENLKENERELAAVKKQQKEEVVKRQELSENTAQIILEKAISLHQKLNYEAALNELNESLKLKPDFQEALNLKAIILTGSFKFTEALEVANKIEDYTNQYFIDFAQNYSIDTQENGLLSTDALLNILDEIQSDKMLEEQGDYERFKNKVSKQLFRQITFSTFSRYPVEERLSVLEDILSISNPQCGDSFLKIESDEKSLTIYIENDSEINSLDALHGLPITQLSLKNTGIEDISGLNDSPLERLDLTNTKVHDLKALTHLPITELNLTGTPVTDLSSIMKSPIKTLYLGSTKISPLEQTNIFSLSGNSFLTKGNL